MTSKRAVRDSGSGSLALVGVVLYCIAWFVPVWRGQELFGSAGGWLSLGAESRSGPGISGPDWLPGWQACEIAWELLVGDAQGGDPVRQRIVGSTCLTNVVMLVALLALVARRRSPGLGVVLLGCAVLNASWLYLVDHDPFQVCGVGYYLWLGSFVLVGLGMTTAREGRRT